MGLRRPVERGRPERVPALREHLASADRPRARIRGDHAPYDLHTRRRSPRARLGRWRARLGSRRGGRLELPARVRGQARRAAWCIRAASPGPGPCGRRHGVLQSGGPRARRGSAADADEGRRADRPVHGAQARRRRTGSVLHAVVGHAVCGGIRRLLQAAESSLGTCPRLHQRRTAGATVPGLRPPGRPGPHKDDGGQHQRWPPGALIRESLPRQRRDVSLAAVGRGALSWRAEDLRRRT